jgi:hypothetical protein
LLRLFFGRQLGAEACRELVRDARARAEAELTEMRGIRAELETDSTPDAPYILLTVRAGEHSARASIAWADEALKVLDGLGSPASPTAPNSASVPS